MWQVCPAEGASVPVSSFRISESVLKNKSGSSVIVFFEGADSGAFSGVGRIGEGPELPQSPEAFASGTLGCDPLPSSAAVGGWTSCLRRPGSMRAIMAAPSIFPEERACGCSRGARLGPLGRHACERGRLIGRRKGAYGYRFFGDRDFPGVIDQNTFGEESAPADAVVRMTRDEIAIMVDLEFKSWFPKIPSERSFLALRPRSRSTLWP
ncbi:hypothetical protein SBA4_1570005 [Candidatus Sulfopaludibacter sp. SbA4]|nr:hypothetical protein SBA4_1570005 [Candidatus Sulfopaludibacter sp. SbA4]